MHSSFFLLALVGLGAATPTAPSSQPVIPPSQDPFYRVPDNVDDFKPGAILNQRYVNVSSLASLPGKVEHAYQLLYRTTDSLGNATATVTTIMVPQNANTSRLLSYQIAEDAVWINCAPSYTLRNPVGSPGADSADTRPEQLFMDAALEHGYVVAVPDHLGPNSAFLCDVQSGHAVLDGIRATRASSKLTGVSASGDVALWGYSGGSMASDFAVELAPSYAPDLPIIGAALGGTVPNITNAVRSLNKSPEVGLVPAGLTGLTRQYPDVSAVIKKYLKPSKAAEFNKVNSQCLAANEKQFANQDIFATYFDGDTEVLRQPAIEKAFAASDAGHATPHTPLFVYKAIHDEVSPLADTEKLVKQYCDAGVSVNYLRDEKWSHPVLALNAAGYALAWLIGRFDGVAPGGCRTTNTTTSLTSPLSEKVLGPTISQDLRELLEELA